jgi:GNAT superfamily N-acetyltransferase
MTDAATNSSLVPVIREARPTDVDAVAAFTRDTWGDRYDDYMPRVFPAWVAADDPDRGTFVATLPPEAVEGSDAIAERDGRETGDTLVEGDGGGAAAPGESEAVVGCIQGALLTDWEAWGQGIRVDPAARGFGVGSALATAALDWARERGATVCRNMVFSWNVAGLGQSRAAGFEPETEFRFAHPEPAGTSPTAAESSSYRPVSNPDPNAAWAFWTDGDARDHLRGLAMDPDESWACSELTREQLRAAADDGRLLAVAAGDRFAGFAVRTRVWERPSDGADDGPERVAVYGIAAWRDADAAGVLYQSIAADAAAVDANTTRVLIPETVEHVSDTAANRVPVAGEPDFVLRADLTDGGDAPADL